VTLVTDADVVVVGAGAVGLTTAWRLLQDGLSVTVVDPAPGQGTSSVAAGMLAPATEIWWDRRPLAALGRQSVELWPKVAAQLEAETGRSIGFSPSGTVSLACSYSDRPELAELAHCQIELGFEVETLSGEDCRELEPLLGPSVQVGLVAPGDHQVDNRALISALIAAVAARGGRFVHSRAAAIRSPGRDSPAGELVLADGGITKAQEAIVVASGVGTTQLAGIMPPPLRPVGGQILRLRAEPPFRPRTRNLRALVDGRHVYLVVRESGEVVVGATMEERGETLTVRAGGVRELLEDAWRLMPSSSEWDLIECRTGLRPATPDGLPVIGSRPDHERLIMATGHFRNGILLAPITAEAIHAYLGTSVWPEYVSEFKPHRFERTSD
jgi:glycine oxidase